MTSPATSARVRLVFNSNSRVAVTVGIESSVRSMRIVKMNEGATAEVIESHPTANAKARRSRTANARMQAGTERIGPNSRKGARVRTRSEARPRRSAATPAAREKRANRSPSASEFVVKRNEPRGVAADNRPSTPPCPENARVVRGAVRRKSIENANDSLGATRRRMSRRLLATMTPPSPNTTGYPATVARKPPRIGATIATVVNVAVTAARRPARLAGAGSRARRQVLGSAESGRERTKGKPPHTTNQARGGAR